MLLAKISGSVHDYLLIPKEKSLTAFLRWNYLSSEISNVQSYVLSFKFNIT